MFANWIGRSVDTLDIATVGPVRRFAATLDTRFAEDMLPPLGHWLFHLPDAPQAVLAADGHPMKGGDGLLPPIAQPRRMWAGGRIRFLAPIRIGAEMRKRTTVIDIAEKSGTAGGMTFVTLRHTIVADDEDAIVEEQDLVYLPVAPPAVAKRGQVEPESIRAHDLPAALLFRFSALTFNAHRIHYDVDYARSAELYPGLVVHGPLQAMLLLRLAQADGIDPAHFSFRGRAPLYSGTGATANRAGMSLWMCDAAGGVTMTAEVE